MRAAMPPTVRARRVIRLRTQPSSCKAMCAASHASDGPRPQPSEAFARDLLPQPKGDDRFRGEQTDLKKDV
jgi:hypothetical protein